MGKKTYKSFGDAIDELRMGAGLSYDRLSLEVGIAQSYLYHIVNRRKASAPKNEIIKSLADFFHVDPGYFYEYRLRQLLEFIDQNREFVDYCLRQSKKFNKGNLQKDLKKGGKDSTAVQEESEEESA